MTKILLKKIRHKKKLVLVRIIYRNPKLKIKVKINRK